MSQRVGRLRLTDMRTSDTCSATGVASRSEDRDLLHAHATSPVPSCVWRGRVASTSRNRGCGEASPTIVGWGDKCRTRMRRLFRLNTARFATLSKERWGASALRVSEEALCSFSSSLVSNFDMCNDREAVRNSWCTRLNTRIRRS